MTRFAAMIAKSSINSAFALALVLVRRFLDLLAVVNLAMALAFAFPFALTLAFHLDAVSTSIALNSSNSSFSSVLAFQ